MSVSLTKGQKVSLTKPDGSALKNVAVGLGWDAAGGLFGGGSIDLDASCVVLDENKRKIDVVWFRQLDSIDRAIHHTGDNRTGAGDGDDETIQCKLGSLNPAAKFLVFTVNSFLGQTFDKVKNAKVRLYDMDTNTELFSFDLAAKGSHTGLIMAKVYNHNGTWKAHAIGEPASGRTVDDILPAIASLC